MHGYVYKTTNSINRKSYIGKKHSSVVDLSYLGSGILLHKAIKKYGRENFSVEVLSWANSTSELNELEKKFISEQSPEYNLALGGDGGNIISHLPNAKEIHEKQRSGIKAWHARMTAEEKSVWIEKIRRNRKGNFREGYVPTKEHRKKSSVSNILAWKLDDGTRKEIHAKAMLKRRGIQTHNSQRVTINGITYDSLTKAAKELAISRKTLNDRIKSGKIQCTLIEKK